MGRLAETAAWKELQAHYAKTQDVTLANIFAQDPARCGSFTVRMAGLEADLSRNHITKETVTLLVRLAEERGVPALRDRMMRGEKINVTENRAALHTALRTPKDMPIFVDGHDVIPDVRAVHRKMESFTDDVREGRWHGATGQPIRDVVNIGIGGSDLGPRMVMTALRACASGPRVRFVANADAADILNVLEDLDPATTLFVVVSKTFTTQEMLLNATTARQWLVAKLGEAAVEKHFVAVSTNRQAVESFGIAAANMFAMWDWVGGRYSLWSSVGLSIALGLGWKHFKALLDGAAAMDEHFSTETLERNMPVLAALTGIWYRNFWGVSCEAVLPYSERLRELPRYLQQLVMESNGKSVTLDGEPVECATSPAIFGDCGTISQHSFHQCLHQGTDMIPANFIGVRNDDLAKPEHHRALLANMRAQAEALRQGAGSNDPHRSNPGNRPSTLYWLDKLDPYHLGLLLALFEHRTFVQGAIWGINPFDQFGVELGKKMAREIHG